MKALLVGGTGIISAGVAAQAMAEGWEITLLNRGHSAPPQGVQHITADIGDEAAARAALAGQHYDVAVQFLTYTAADAQRDIRLFAGLVDQLIYISSASTYQKPVRAYPITESTAQANPYSQYARDKIAAEEVFLAQHRADGFPVTIVRPSHTYDERKAPVAMHGPKGSWSVLARMLAGKSVIIPGDGTSLWTCTHARDFAVGFVGLMGNPHAIGTAVHITSDEVMTWNMIYQTIADALGVELKGAHVASDFLAVHGTQFGIDAQLLGDKANTVIFDNTKIKRLVPHFVCKTSMAQGIRAAALNMLATPALQTPDAEFDAWSDRILAMQEREMTAL